jgi:hypothetical protein
MRLCAHRRRHAATFAPAPLRAEGLRWDAMQIAVVISGATFKLEAIVVRPDDGAPHPLAATRRSIAVPLRLTD